MFEILAENLKKLGYRVSCFATAAEAAACLDAQIDGQSVGFGGSVTLEQMAFMNGSADTTRSSGIRALPTRNKAGSCG